VHEAHGVVDGVPQHLVGGEAFVDLADVDRDGGPPDHLDVVHRTARRADDLHAGHGRGAHNPASVRIDWSEYRKPSEVHVAPEMVSTCADCAARASSTSAGPA